MKTVLLLTNPSRLQNLCRQLHRASPIIEDQVIALLGQNPSMLLDRDNCRVIAAPDTWTGVQWLKTFLASVTGELHVARHTNAPSNDEWALAIPVFEECGKRIPLAYGMQGMHEARREDLQCKPYCLLADLVKAKITKDEDALAAWQFNVLWEHLEEHDPILDLLADKLAYLHAAFAGVAPGEGKAIKAALNKSDNRDAIQECLKKLDGKTYEPTQYNDFTKLRDLVLSLADATPKS